MVFSKNEPVFIRELSDLTLQIIFEACWIWMNVPWKRSTGGNNSIYLPSWKFDLHCRIEEISSPWLIWIICHHVLRHPSECETSSMGKHLLAKARISKHNKIKVSVVTELTSSTLNETAGAMLKRHWNQGIPIVCSQRKFKFNIDVLSILTKLTDKILLTVSKQFSNCQISPRHLESLPHVRIGIGLYSMRHDMKTSATTFIQCIMKRIGVTCRQHPEQPLLNGINTDSGCN